MNGIIDMQVPVYIQLIWRPYVLHFTEMEVQTCGTYLHGKSVYSQTIMKTSFHLSLTF